MTKFARMSLALWQKLVKPLFLVLIVVFIAMSVYPLSVTLSVTEGLGPAIAPVGLRMSQSQAGGPASVYKAQKAADIVQNTNNNVFK